jgi:hypothetical protein
MHGRLTMGSFVCRSPLDAPSAAALLRRARRIAVGAEHAGSSATGTGSNDTPPSCTRMTEDLGFGILGRIRERERGGASGLPSVPMAHQFDPPGTLGVARAAAPLRRRPLPRSRAAAPEVEGPSRGGLPADARGGGRRPRGCRRLTGSFASRNSVASKDGRPRLLFRRPARV